MMQVSQLLGRNYRTEWYFYSAIGCNGKAAIDAVDQLGYIDRNRVAVGGHSYGAFMTTNLLTYSNDFACGIAKKWRL